MFSLPDAPRANLSARIAHALTAGGLREPALVLLTIHAPLAFLGSQALLALGPFLGPVLGYREARELALFLDDPRAVAELLARLEQPAPEIDIAGAAASGAGLPGH